MEFLTDKEKRLLLSALTREKKVCAEVDNESCREPYEESLVSVINSLEKKFYYDKIFKKIYTKGRTDGIEALADLVEAAMLNGTFDITDVGKMVEQLKEQKNE